MRDTPVRAYIGLGANLADPVEQLRQALLRIAAIEGVRLLRASRLYRSPPMGPPNQPDYCNAACAVDSRLAPRALLRELQAIEDALGRRREAMRWAPRMLDLDLLHVEGVSAADSDLILPHPGIAKRNFVLVPLAEVAPELDIPGLGPIAARAREIGAEDLSIWAEA